MNDSRHDLIRLLDAHVAADESEAHDLARMRHAARNLEAPFSRTQVEAHFTGSAVIVDPSGTQLCLVHHAKLDRWLQPGGHFEPGDLSMAEVALREAREETGLEVTLHPGSPLPLDVDAHFIPERNVAASTVRVEPSHHHLDVRFLLVAKDAAQLAHDPNESNAIRWVNWEQAQRWVGEPAFQRMLEKARKICAPTVQKSASLERLNRTSA